MSQSQLVVLLRHFCPTATPTERVRSAIAALYLRSENETCTGTNWQQLWTECKACDPCKRLYICMASYHTTAVNSQVVDGLAALPPHVYKYAPDV